MVKTSYLKPFAALFIYSCLLFFPEAPAQTLSNLRRHYIFPSADTIQIDTLSIIPGSFFIVLPANVFPDSSAYSLNYSRAQLSWKKMPAGFRAGDSLLAGYRVFPYFFENTFRDKDIRKIEQDASGILNPFLFDYSTGKNTGDFFHYEGLKKNGSISRGVSFGNNQDVVLNSSLNLQLAGKISDNVDVLAAITDDKIPVQPEGNTQQLQEFDKVFIQFSNANNRLLAGDFELKRPDSYFMNFYKKSQGGSFSGSFATGYDQKGKPKDMMNITASAAVSKGRFARNQIPGAEGNQGPYRLQGSGQEMFIVVLSGSEKIYVDGQLLSRGQDNDYIIDYNTAEVTFTPKHLITKDSRIVAEFQYSDKNYVRSLYYFNDEYRKNNLKVKVNFFSEQDSKNQPVHQELTDSNKVFLKSIGDNINEAVIPNIDSVAYSPDQILYGKTDSSYTSCDGVLHDAYYFYTSNADSAHFRLGFSLVGQGNGNYIPVNTAANGKVYRFIPPVNGLCQGSYEPVVLLVTPKKQQMLTTAVEYAFGKNTGMSVEGALSNNDINTFAVRDKANDKGYALRMNVFKVVPLSTSDSSWKINSAVNYEYAGQQFKPLERYRSVEFERDWNTVNIKTHSDEHLGGVDVGIGHTKYGETGYHLKGFLNGSAYTGYMQSLNSRWAWKAIRFQSDASLLRNKGEMGQAAYLRHNAELSKTFRYVKAGVREMQENNRMIKDTLLGSSFSFNEWELYAANPDSTKNRYRVYHSQRRDNGIRDNDFSLATRAENTGVMLELNRNPGNRLAVNSTYRKLYVQDSHVTSQKPSTTLLNRIEYNLLLLKGAITSSTFYEIGTGQELKKEYAFISVANGTGYYQWNDYNKNGIKELSEFEVASFKDSANYMKIFVPTNEYVKTHSNQFNEVLSFSPAAYLQSPSGFGKFISRFSNQLLARMDRKTQGEKFLLAMNPLQTEISDSGLVSGNSSLQDIFYFNRTGSLWGMDINVLDNKNKLLLTNGFESREVKEKGGNIRWNITRKFGLNSSYKTGIKTNRSEFTSRNYHILYEETEPRFIFQPNVSFRASVSYKYSYKRNTDGDAGERAIQSKVGGEIKYNHLKQGSVILKMGYIRFGYNAAENTALSYEMLEGLKNGENITWNISFQRTIGKNMQLNFNYEGRKPASIPAIHTGGVQARAFF